MHNSFAQQLLKLRTEQQLSQTDIANLLFVSRQAVSKWENGDAEPSLDNLISLSRILNVSLDTVYLIVTIKRQHYQDKIMLPFFVILKKEKGVNDQPIYVLRKIFKRKSFLEHN